MRHMCLPHTLTFICSPCKYYKILNILYFNTVPSMQLYNLLWPIQRYQLYKLCRYYLYNHSGYQCRVCASVKLLGGLRPLTEVRCTQHTQQLTTLTITIQTLGSGCNMTVQCFCVTTTSQSSDLLNILHRTMHVVICIDICNIFILIYRWIHIYIYIYKIQNEIKIVLKIYIYIC